MRDSRAIKELAFQCRPLIIILLISYCFLIIMFATVMASSPHVNVSAPITDDDDLNAAHEGHLTTSRVHYGVLACTTMIATILCGLYLTATFVMNPWLAIPYFVFHICILVYMAALLYIYFDTVLSIKETYEGADDSWTKFSLYLIYHLGGYPFFCGILIVSFYIYGTIPMWKFISQLWLYLREKKAESSSRARSTRDKDNTDTVSYAGLRRVSIRPRSSTDTGEEEYSGRERRESRIFPAGATLTVEQPQSTRGKKTKEHSSRRKSIA